MKKLFKILLALIVAAIMSFSMMSVVTAEVSTEEKTGSSTTIVEDDGAKAYTLVWKFKSENGHMYKRRWNATLNKWYDPAWILVY